MSIATLTRSDDDFEREFAGMVAEYDRTDLPEADFDGHRRPKRPARGADVRTAIEQSRREH